MNVKQMTAILRFIKKTEGLQEASPPSVTVQTSALVTPAGRTVIIRVDGTPTKQQLTLARVFCIQNQGTAVVCRYNSAFGSLKEPAYLVHHWPAVQTFNFQGPRENSENANQD